MCIADPLIVSKERGLGRDRSCRRCVLEEMGIVRQNAAGNNLNWSNASLIIGPASGFPDSGSYHIPRLLRNRQ